MSGSLLFRSVAQVIYPVFPPKTPRIVPESVRILIKSAGSPGCLANRAGAVYTKREAMFPTPPGGESIMRLSIEELKTFARGAVRVEERAAGVVFHRFLEPERECYRARPDFHAKT